MCGCSAQSQQTFLIIQSSFKWQIPQRHTHIYTCYCRMLTSISVKLTSSHLYIITSHKCVCLVAMHVLAWFLPQMLAYFTAPCPTCWDLQNASKISNQCAPMLQAAATALRGCQSIFVVIVAVAVLCYLLVLLLLSFSFSYASQSTR